VSKRKRGKRGKKDELKVLAREIEFFGHLPRDVLVYNPLRVEVFGFEVVEGGGELRRDENRGVGEGDEVDTQVSARALGFDVGLTSETKSARCIVGRFRSSLGSH
jgi:hypothetical protein